MMKQIPFVLFSLLLCFTANSWGLQEIHLDPGSWSSATRAELDQLINDNRDQKKVVVFGFDNTLLAGSIEDATLQVLRDERLIPEKPVVSDSSLDCLFDRDEEQLQHFSAVGSNIKQFPSLSVYDIVHATKSAYRKSRRGYDYRYALQNGTQRTSQEPGPTPPFFYPEMIDLCGQLIKGGFDVWIVSASNVWSLRWMVTAVLNRELQDRFGEGVTIASDHIIGTSTLLSCSDQKLYRDNHLAQAQTPFAKKYRNLDTQVLKQLHVTQQLDFPLSINRGKISTIHKYITPHRPFLVVGNCIHELPMLKHGINRLWIAHLETDGLQQEFVDALEERTGRSNGRWLIQQVLGGEKFTFVESIEAISKQLSHHPLALAACQRSLSILESLSIPLPPSDVDPAFPPQSALVSIPKPQK